MPEYPYIPPRNTKVWIANLDGTAEKRWVDTYDPENDTLYLRSVESEKKWNNGLRGYPANTLGVTIFYSCQDARKKAKLLADEAARRRKEQRCMAYE